jgi:hypothetical protein
MKVLTIGAGSRLTYNNEILQQEEPVVVAVDEALTSRGDARSGGSIAFHDWAEDGGDDRSDERRHVRMNDG